MNFGLLNKPRKFTIVVAILFGIVCVYLIIFSIKVKNYDDCAYYNMLTSDDLAKQCLQKDIELLETIQYNASLYFQKLKKDYELSNIHIEAINKLNLDKDFKLKEIKIESNGIVKNIKVIDLNATINGKINEN